MLSADEQALVDDVAASVVAVVDAAIALDAARIPRTSSFMLRQADALSVAVARHRAVLARVAARPIPDA